MKKPSAAVAAGSQPARRPRLGARIRTWFLAGVVVVGPLAVPFPSVVEPLTVSPAHMSPVG